MSTRACYIFEDDDGAHCVYKHDDGYPFGAQQAIKKSFAFAWDLPRFDAGEFASAFVAKNKTCSGGIRLMGGKNGWKKVGDIEYRYHITFDNDVDMLKVIAWVFADNNTWKRLGSWHQYKVDEK